MRQAAPQHWMHAAKEHNAKRAPKYRNPDNAAQTWSGRGKHPLWFVDALKKKGVTEESMLIQGQGAASAKTAPAKKAVVKASKKAPAKKKATAKK